MFLLELQALEVGKKVNSWSLRDLLPLTFWESRSWGSGEGTTHISQRLFVPSALRLEQHMPFLFFSEYP